MTSYFGVNLRFFARLTTDFKNLLQLLIITRTLIHHTDVDKKKYARFRVICIFARFLGTLTRNWKKRLERERTREKARVKKSVWQVKAKVTTWRKDTKPCVLFFYLCGLGLNYSNTLFPEYFQTQPFFSENQPIQSQSIDQMSLNGCVIDSK